MPDFLSPITDICQTQIQASRRLCDAIFTGTGKLEHAVLDASHRAVDDQLRCAQAIGNARDMQVISNLQATFWSSQPALIQKFQQDYVRILTEVQNEFGRATQAMAEQLGAQMAQSMPTGFAGSRTPGRGTVGNPFADMMSRWESMMQGVSRLTIPIASATVRTAEASTGYVRAAVDEIDEAEFDEAEFGHQAGAGRYRGDDRRRAGGTVEETASTTGEQNGSEPDDDKAPRSARPHPQASGSHRPANNRRK